MNRFFEIYKKFQNDAATTVSFVYMTVEAERVECNSQNQLVFYKGEQVVKIVDENEWQHVTERREGKCI
jgi:hypothetical protein